MVPQSPRITGSYLVPVVGDLVIAVVRRAVQHRDGLGIVELTAERAIIAGRTGLLPRASVVLEFYPKPPASTLITARKPAFVWSGTDTGWDAPFSTASGRN